MTKIFRQIFLFFILSFCLSVKVKAVAHNCKKPEMYNLSATEITSKNTEFFCWEIRYLRDYKNTLSMNLNSYFSLFPKYLSFDNINSLRKLGLTPEKVEYLYKNFIDTDLDDKNFNKLIKNAVSKLKHSFNNVIYVYGRPVWFIPGFLNINPISALASNLRFKTVYSPVFKVLGLDCISLITPSSFLNNYFDQYPVALRPVGVIGKYFINAFAEVVGEVKENSSLFPHKYSVYGLGSNQPIAYWNNWNCHIYDIEKDVKNASSCIACTMFEIAFNTVSRIGFVLYDKLARYVLYLLVVLFSLWSLLLFFNNSIKDAEPFSYIKTFFTKSVFLVIVAAFLSVSIKSENNVINYFITPFTDFSFDYVKFVNSAIDTEKDAWQCKYKERNIGSSEVLFSSNVRTNIVCSLDRIGYFNNFFIIVGKYQFISGWNKFINFSIPSGIVKMFLGLGIMSIFFYYNLTIPFFFIESLFRIALVIFLAPLFLMGYAFDKGKQFVKQGFNTFLSAIFQLVSLSLMSLIISLLMMYILKIDIFGFYKSVKLSNFQDITSQLFLLISLDTNSLLQIIYTGIICWVLLGEALTVANKFSGYNKTETLPKLFLQFSKKIISVSTSLIKDKVYMIKESKKIADNLSDSFNHKQNIKARYNKIHEESENE